MAVFEIKIRNFLQNNELVTSEENVYSIPLSESVHGEDYIFVDPKVKSEMGKTGSFEFTFYPNHPLYDSLLQMKTMFRVTYFGTTIFYGRVLTIDFDSMSFKKSVHCEGYMAFLMDSLYRGLPEKNRTEKSASEYITWLITNHNNMLDMNNVYPVKHFDIGLVPGTYTPNIEAMQRPLVEGTKRFGSSSWQNTADALGELTKEYGGFFRTRYDELQDKVYLDWLCCYFGGSSSDPSKWSDRIVEVAKNIISISSSTEVENLFTVLIPIGKKESNGKGDDSGDNLYLDELYLYVNDITDHYSLDQLNVGFHSAQDYLDSINRYGLIYKSVNFSNATTQEQLRSWAWDYIKNNYHGENISFTISAVDMRIVDGISDPLLPGDKVVVHYAIGNGQFDDKNLVIISAEWDLHNPDKNSYTIGIPDKDFQKTYGKSSDKNSGKGGGGGSAGGPSSNNEGEDDDSKNEQRYFFKEHILSAADNSQEYQSYKEKYGEDAASSILLTSDLVLNSAFNENDPSSEAIVRKLIIDGHDGTITGYTAPVVVNPKRRQAMEVFKTVTIDVVNSMFDVNERRDLALREAYAQHGQGTWSQFVQKAVNYNQEPHRVLEVGVESVRQENETQQYLRFKTKKSGSHPSTLDEEVGKLIFTDNTTSVVDGETGTLTTASVELAGVENELIDKLANETAGYQASISLDGEAALVETNASNNAAAASSKSYVIDGRKGKSVGTSVSVVDAIGEKVDKVKNEVTGFKPNVTMSGPEVKVATSNNNQQNNIEINGRDSDGNGGVIGTVSVGDDTVDLTTNKRWTITINKPYTYTYQHPDPSDPTHIITEQHTVPPRSIEAEDLHVTKEYDSLKSKLIVVDQLIANRIDVNEFNALKAKVDTLTADVITANTRVSSQFINSSEFKTSSAIVTGNLISGTVTIGDANSSGYSVANYLYRSFRFYKNTNVTPNMVYLYGTTIGGTENLLASFSLPVSGGGGGNNSSPEQD